MTEVFEHAGQSVMLEAHERRRRQWVWSYVLGDTYHRMEDKPLPTAEMALREAKSHARLRMEAQSQS